MSVPGWSHPVQLAGCLYMLWYREGVQTVPVTSRRSVLLLWMSCLRKYILRNLRTGGKYRVG